MKIFIINPYVDPAGAGHAIFSAINRLTNHKCRYVVGFQTYFEVDDICLTHRRNEGKLKETFNEMFTIAEESDVLHFNFFDHNMFLKLISEKQKEGTPLKLDDFNFNWNKYKGRKPFIYHDHGAWLEGRELSGLHNNCSLYNMYDYYAGVIVCNPFSLNTYNRAVWLQNIIPQDNELYKPIERNYDGEILVAHSPSSRRYKGTNIIIDIINDLRKEGYPIRLVLVEKTRRNMALKMRQKCHIIIDSLYDTFPNLNSLEGMSQGQVAITRVKPEMMQYYNTIGDEEMPIIGINNSFELKVKLAFLLLNRDKLKEIGGQSRKWIEKNYADHILIKKWIRYYKEVIEKWQLECQ